MIVRQFLDPESYTYTYLITSAPGRDAVIIDPVQARIDDYIGLLQALDVRLVHAIDTHTHADHITAAGTLRETTGCTTLMGQFTKADCVSHRLKDGERIRVRDFELTALYTPGHTNDSYCFVLGGDQPQAVFTGDTLLIRGSGRTDFQEGDAGKSWESITNRLFTLPDSTLVYPGHDYKGWTFSTIGEEKRINPRLAGKTKEQYVAIMNGLNLPSPKYMDVAVPANLRCGNA